MQSSEGEYLSGVNLSPEEAYKRNVKVTDKRGTPKVEVVPAQQDVFTSMLEKTFKFVVEQSEFYTILQYPRPVRKKFGRELGKLMSTFPHMSKAGFRGPKA